MRHDRDEQLRCRLEAFGARVRAFRAYRGMTQEGLAEASGLHRTYIGSVERGERNLAIGNVWSLADALGVDVTDLLGEGASIHVESK